MTRTRTPVRRSMPRVVGALLLTLATAAVAIAAAGDLDPTFDEDGRVVLPFAGFGLRDIAAGSGDAVIAAGTVALETGPERFGVARLTSAGIPDDTFSGDGLATATFTTLEVGASAVAMDGDRPVVVGDGREGDGPTRLALARFEADGDADPTFGEAGVGRLWTTVDVDGPVPADHATDVVVQDDGRIVVVGSADGDHRAIVVRYEEDGDLDPTFSGNGLAITSLGDGAVRAEAVAIDGEDRIVIAGRAGTDLFLARFRPGGGPDPSFGDAGRVRIDLGARERALSLAIDGAGRLVVTGSRTTAFDTTLLVARIRPGGALDPVFAGDGWRTVGASVGGTDVMIQGTKVVVGGGRANGARFVVIRLRAAGPPDGTFGGGDGIVQTSFDCCDAGVRALAPGPAGTIVAGGGGAEGVLARYLGA